MNNEELYRQLEDGLFPEVAKVISEEIISQGKSLNYETAQILKICVHAASGRDYQLTWETLRTLLKNLDKYKPVYPERFYLAYVIFECSILSPIQHRISESLDLVRESYALTVLPSEDKKILMDFLEGVAELDNPFDIKALTVANVHLTERYINALKYLDQVVHSSRAGELGLYNIIHLARIISNNIWEVLARSDYLNDIDPGIFFLGMDRVLDLEKVILKIKEVPKKNTLEFSGRDPILQHPGNLRIDKKIQIPVTQVAKPDPEVRQLLRRRIK